MSEISGLLIFWGVGVCLNEMMWCGEGVFRGVVVLRNAVWCVMV